MKVTVLHNVEKDPQGRSLGFFGYEPGQALAHVFDLDLTETESGDGWEEVVYHLLNVGDDPTFGTPDDRALAYRAQRNRSLSVGDVLMVDGVGRAVDSFGYKTVRVDPAQAVTPTHA